MTLRDDEKSELVRAVKLSSTAGGAVEFLRRLAREGRVQDRTAAISAATSAFEVNASIGRRHLASRIPGVLMNNYFSEVLTADEYDSLVQVTLANKNWSKQLVASAEQGDGGALEYEVQSLVSEARQKLKDVA
jgi:hypothetical protein